MHITLFRQLLSVHCYPPPPATDTPILPPHTSVPAHYCVNKETAASHASWLPLARPPEPTVPLHPTTTELFGLVYSCTTLHWVLLKALKTVHSASS